MRAWHVSCFISVSKKVLQTDVEQTIPEQKKNILVLNSAPLGPLDEGAEESIYTE